jgi:hypothetical protein
MQLDYSFNGIAPLFCPGELPFPEMRSETIKVSISGSADGSFPPVFPMGDLLCYCRSSTNEFGITLLLTYLAGITPPSNEPQPPNEWGNVPNSPIYGQIRIRLTPEAIKQIRKVSGDGYDYELSISDAQFTNVTGNAQRT